MGAERLCQLGAPQLSEHRQQALERARAARTGHVSERFDQRIDLGAGRGEQQLVHALELLVARLVLQGTGERHRDRLAFGERSRSRGDRAAGRCWRGDPHDAGRWPRYIAWGTDPHRDRRAGSGRHPPGQSLRVLAARRHADSRRSTGRRRADSGAARGLPVRPSNPTSAARSSRDSCACASACAIGSTASPSSRSGSSKCPAASIAARRSAGTVEVRNSSTVGSADDLPAIPRAVSAVVRRRRSPAQGTLDEQARRLATDPSEGGRRTPPSRRRCVGWNTQRSSVGNATVAGAHQRPLDGLARRPGAATSARSTVSTALGVPIAPSASSAAACTSGSDSALEQRAERPHGVARLQLSQRARSGRAHARIGVGRARRSSAPTARASPSAPSARAA